MRKITVVSTQSDSVYEHMSGALTWGALKTELGDRVNDDMKVSVKETRNDLSHNEAQLPFGEFVLFLFPAKIKSGDTDGNGYPSIEEHEAALMLKLAGWVSTAEI